MDIIYYFPTRNPHPFHPQDGIVAFGIDRDRVALWTLRIQQPNDTGSRTLFSRLDGIHALGSQIPRITTSTVYTSQLRTGLPAFSLVTGHEDGSVRFWRLTLSVL